MNSLDAVEFPKDMYWVDEFLWTPVEQTEDYSVTGSLLIDSGVKQAGRPITIQPFSNAYSWVKRSVVLQLQALSEIQDKEMTLTLDDGRTFTVRFRHGDGKPFEARPRFHVFPPQDEDYYMIILRLMEV